MAMAKNDSTFRGRHTTRAHDRDNFSGTRRGRGMRRDSIKAQALHRDPHQNDGQVKEKMKVIYKQLKLKSIFDFFLLILPFLNTYYLTWKRRFIADLISIVFLYSH